MASTPPAGPLLDHDGRDGQPGLLVERGIGIAETDTTRMQRWAVPAAGLRLQGDWTVEVSVATPDFDTGTSGELAGALYDCADPPDVEASADCRLLVSGLASFDQADLGGDFGPLAIALPSLDHTFGAGRQLVLKLAPTAASGDDLWLAFGAADHPARLRE